MRVCSQFFRITMDEFLKATKIALDPGCIDEFMPLDAFFTKSCLVLGTYSLTLKKV